MATRQVGVPATVGPWLSVIGGVAMAVGAFLPWVSLSGLFATSVNGFHSAQPLSFAAGPMFVVLGAVAIALGVVGLTRPSSARYLGDSIIGTGLLAIPPAVVGWWTIHHLSLVKILVGPLLNTQPTSGEVTSIGVGYVLCVVGLLVTSAAGFLVLSSSKTRILAPTTRK